MNPCLRSPHGLPFLEFVRVTDASPSPSQGYKVLREATDEQASPIVCFTGEDPAWQHSATLAMVLIRFAAPENRGPFRVFLLDSGFRAPPPAKIPNEPFLPRPVIEADWHAGLLEQIGAARAAGLAPVLWIREPGNLPAVDQETLAALDETLCIVATSSQSLRGLSPDLMARVTEVDPSGAWHDWEDVSVEARRDAPHPKPGIPEESRRGETDS